jgi:hypothetical protein
MDFHVDGAKLVYPSNQGQSSANFVPSSQTRAYTAISTLLSLIECVCVLASVDDHSERGCDGNWQFEDQRTPHSPSEHTPRNYTVYHTLHYPPLQINIGITALEFLKSTISLTVDASSTLTIDGNAAASTSGGANATGCVDANTALSVAANANADLGGVFSKAGSVSLFSKTFDLFKVRVSPPPTFSLLTSFFL